MRKLLFLAVAIAIILVASSTAEQKIRPDQINTSIAFPAFTMTSGANITLDGGYVVGATGLGDVVGPSSATDGYFPLWDGVTGKLLKNSIYAPSSFAAAAHNQSASTITSGTLDGDRLPGMSITQNGSVPATGSPAGKYLKDDGTWSTPIGVGDVTGPDSATSGNFARFNGTTGNLINDSGYNAADFGDVFGPSSATDGHFPLWDGVTGKLLNNSIYAPASFAAASHAHVAADVYSASPSGEFLKDDGTWDTPAGGSANSTYTNIETYGAVGDNSTDCTSAIQDAIDDGGRIYIPPGNWRITSPIVIGSGETDNVVIAGAGSESNIVADLDYGEAVIKNSGVVGGIELKDFDIIPYGTEITGVDGIHLDYVNRGALIDNVRVWQLDTGFKLTNKIWSSTKITNSGAYFCTAEGFNFDNANAVSCSGCEAIGSPVGVFIQNGSEMISFTDGNVAGSVGGPLMEEAFVIEDSSRVYVSDTWMEAMDSTKHADCEARTIEITGSSVIMERLYILDGCVYVHSGTSVLRDTIFYQTTGTKYGKVVALDGATVQTENLDFWDGSFAPDNMVTGNITASQNNVYGAGTPGDSSMGKIADPVLGLGDLPFEVTDGDHVTLSDDYTDFVTGWRSIKAVVDEAYQGVKFAPYWLPLDSPVTVVAVVKCDDPTARVLIGPQGGTNTAYDYRGPSNVVKTDAGWRILRNTLKTSDGDLKACILADKACTFWIDSVQVFPGIVNDAPYGTVTATTGSQGDVSGPASSTDSNFAGFNGTTGKIIKDSGNKASDFVAASLLTEQGDLAYRDGSGWQTLHHGTSGQYLKTGAHGGNPSWDTPAGSSSSEEIYVTVGPYDWCDNVTDGSGDSTEIQAALNACKNVYIVGASTDYDIDTSIDFGAGDYSIVGIEYAGYKPTLKVDSATTAGIYSNDAANIKIHDIVLDVNSKNIHGMCFDGVSSAEIVGCTVENVLQSAADTKVPIFLTLGSQYKNTPSYISKCNFYNNLGAGVYQTGGSTGNVWITDNMWYGGKPYGTQQYEAFRGENAVISRNKVIGYGTKAQTYSSCAGCGIGGNDNIISDNYIEGVGSSGIVPGYRCTVTGNRIIAPGCNGIDFWYSSFSVIIGNYILNVGNMDESTSSWDQSGIDMADHSEDCSVVGNSIYTKEIADTLAATANIGNAYITVTHPEYWYAGTRINLTGTKYRIDYIDYDNNRLYLVSAISGYKASGSAIASVDCCNFGIQMGDNGDSEGFHTVQANHVLAGKTAFYAVPSGASILPYTYCDSYVYPSEPTFMRDYTKPFVYTNGGNYYIGSYLIGTTDVKSVQLDAAGGGSGDVSGPASAVDSNFAGFNGVTGKIIKDSGSKASDFVASSLLTEQGDLAYRDGSGWQTLHHGTSGQYLKTGAHGANPSWDTPASSGGSMPGFNFTGDTDDELHTFIDANGEGTYYITKELLIDSGLVIDQNHVKLVWPGGYVWPDSSNTVPYRVKVTMTSGSAISISGSYVTLDHPPIIFTNTASTANAIEINAYWTEIISPSIYCADGCGFKFNTNSFYWNIHDPFIIMNDGATTTKGLWFYRGGGNGGIYNGMISGGKYGVYAEQGYPMFQGTYFLNQSENGMYFSPTSAYSTGDAFISGVCIDFCGGDGIKTSNAYKIRGINMDHSWIYCNDVCIWVGNADDWSITDCAMLHSIDSHSIYVATDVDGLTIANNNLKSPATTGCGVIVYNSNTNSDIMVTGNRAVYGSSGCGYQIQGSDVVSWTIIGNKGSVSVPATSAVKISEHNRDT